MSDGNFTIAVAVNDRETLRNNLYLSPGLTNGGRNEILIKENFKSASAAYNSAIDDASNDVIIFVHQDIYLPETWFPDLRRAISNLKDHKADWGVLGCFGSRRAALGGLGQVFTNGRGVHGNRIAVPEVVETLDEILLVLRKSSGLRFDPALPHFHLYGTDICMEARKRGMDSYAFQGFCVHNTNQLLHLPTEFYACYQYVRRKWKKYLPIYASCTKISRFNDELYLRRLRELGDRALGLHKQPKFRVSDPRNLLADQAIPPDKAIPAHRPQSSPTRRDGR